MVYLASFSASYSIHKYWKICPFHVPFMYCIYTSSLCVRWASAGKCWLSIISWNFINDQHNSLSNQFELKREIENNNNKRGELHFVKHFKQFIYHYNSKGAASSTPQAQIILCCVIVYKYIFESSILRSTLSLAMDSQYFVLSRCVMIYYIYLMTILLF